MRILLAVVLAASAGAAMAGKVSCYEEPGSMKQWCYDPSAVRENGSVRMAAVLSGGPRGVKPVGMFFVVDCQKNIAAMQDERGVNYGANYTDATPVARNLSGWICAEPKVKKDASVRLF